jgi:serine/threonine protein kinase/tetratricopeptide (TPR) repeat protein
MTIEPGTKLGRYEVRSPIGAGGMGEVYLALDTELDRTVAIKILPEVLATDEQRLQRFVQEAKAASALNHPHILTIYEIGAIGASRFIATEFIDGDTLRQHIDAGIELVEILEISIQAGSALAAAHAAGIIHRDIKPENIMVRRDGYIKVVDFGLAKLTGAEGFTTDAEAPTRAMVNTGAGTVMGTANYMSPEQAKGVSVDTRTDLWSLGAVLYEMIARHVPFSGETPTETLSLILQREPPPLARFAHDLPAELERIVTKALTKDREERYQTAKDMLIDLRNLKRRLEVDAEIDRTIPPEYRGATATKPTSSGQSAPVTGSGSAALTSGSSTSSAEYIISGIKQHKLAIAGVTGLVLTAVVAGVIGISTYLRGSAAEAAIRSIAVMPFVNESRNADVEYLSDGMTETLISSLSHLPNLNVKARSSVFRYKGKETDSKTVGKELGVQAVLNGRVLQRGDQLTLSLELIDTSTENVIWSEQYNRKQADILSLQGEIARDVSKKLRTRLSGADEQKLAQNSTANPQAYQLYLRGRFDWNKRTFDGLKQAAVYYNQAIEKDPGYALAYSGLAETYALYSNYSVASPKDSMPQAKSAALRALDIDDSLAEAHAALGLYYCNYAWNQTASEREFRRAIELNPNYATAYHWLGNAALLNMARFDEALVAGRRAEELDPLSIIISADQAYNFTFARRYDEAIAQCQRALSLDPNFYYTHYVLGFVYEQKGMYKEAIPALQKSLKLNEDPFAKALLIRALVKTGQRTEAIKLRDELRSESAKRYVPNYFLAMASIALGEKDEAIGLLEKDIAERGNYMAAIEIDPVLDDLRDDPRFATLVQKVVAAKLD